MSMQEVDIIEGRLMSITLGGSREKFEWLITGCHRFAYHLTG